MRYGLKLYVLFVAVVLVVLSAACGVGGNQAIQLFKTIDILPAR